MAGGALGGMGASPGYTNGARWPQTAILLTTAVDHYTLVAAVVITSLHTCPNAPLSLFAPCVHTTVADSQHPAAHTTIFAREKYRQSLQLTSNLFGNNNNNKQFLNSKCIKMRLRYDTRCYFNVRSKADISQLNLPHGTDN